MTKKGEIYIKIIAERLKEARNEKSKTQNDLAEVLNISRAAFGEYERGNNLPPIDKLVIIARELEVSLDWLAGIASENQINLNQIRQAALQIAAGTDTPILSARLGHSNVSTTLNIYAHPLKTKDRKAVDELQSLIYG